MTIVESRPFAQLPTAPSDEIRTRLTAVLRRAGYAKQTGFDVKFPTSLDCTPDFPPWESRERDLPPWANALKVHKRSPNPKVEDEHLLYTVRCASYRREAVFDSNFFGKFSAESAAEADSRALA